MLRGVLDLKILSAGRRLFGLREVFGWRLDWHIFHPLRVTGRFLHR